MSAPAAVPTEGLATAGAPILRVRGGSVRLGPREVLKGVSLAVDAGELVALVGPNGSGKTTLLRASIGLLPWSAGSSWLLGDRVEGLGLRERARRAAWAPQNESPAEDLPLEEYVALGRYPHQGSFGPETSADRAAVDEAIEESHLEGLRHQGVLRISGGELQRALYARVRAQGAPLLVFDEPTSHLDMNHQLGVMSSLRRFTKSGSGRGVLVSMHDLNLACLFADRIVWLSRGRVLADGPPAATIDPERIREVFGVAMEVHRLGSRVFVSPPLAQVPDVVRRLGAPRIHVVAGGGSGGPILSRLVESGYHATAGPLHMLDSDEELCDALAIVHPSEMPFSPISASTRARHRELLQAASVIVLAPILLGPGNLANLEDLLPFAGTRPTFLVGGSPEGRRDFCGGRGARVYEELRRAGAREIASAEELLSALESCPGTAGAAPPVTAALKGPPSDPSPSLPSREGGAP